jgi:hypothetical protein
MQGAYRPRKGVTMSTLPTSLETLIAKFVSSAIAAKGAIDDRNATRCAVVTASIVYHRPDVVVVYDDAGKAIGGLMFQALTKARITLKPTTREIDQAKVVYDLLKSGEIGEIFADKAGKANRNVKVSA